MRLATALALTGSLALPAGAQLTIRLTSAPVSTPLDATVYAAGSFNGWNPAASGYSFTRMPAGSYILTLPASVRGAVEFKLTLGSWARAEATPAGGAAPNRRVTIPAAGADTVDVTVPRWSDSTAAAPRAHSATARVSILSDSFPIPQLGRTRRVWLYLPRGYATSRARYPVLYLQDGQNVFDDATSFSGEWGVDEALDSLPRHAVAPAIVVAVDNGGDRRLDEYDPWKNPEPRLGGGEGEAYAEWLAHTLKPYVDAHYRTRPDAPHTGVGGSSAGALIALYAALRYPETFGRAMLFSTASWLTGTHLLELARRWAPRRPLPRFYFASGAFETPEGEPAGEQRRMVAALHEAGVPDGAVRSVVAPAGKHAEWFWRQEFPAAYRWLFAGEAPARRGHAVR